MRGRTMRALGASLLAGAAVLTGAGAAWAEDENAGATEPTEAGTTFRTATVLDEGEPGTATASTGDYLYWTFPVAAGRTVSVEATVTLPDAATRTGPVTWQVDVMDGLRRRQPCTGGSPTGTAAEDDGSLTLDCTIRTVRPWAEPWSDVPLPGAYYLRLTALEMPEPDLGLPVQAEVVATTADAGGAEASGGELSEPLVPAVGAGTALDDADLSDEEPGEDPEEATDETASVAAVAEPEGGWGIGWWSDRWLWTGAGGVLASLAGVAGYALTRGLRTSRQGD